MSSTTAIPLPDRLHDLPIDALRERLARLDDEAELVRMLLRTRLRQEHARGRDPFAGRPGGKGAAHA